MEISERAERRMAFYEITRETVDSIVNDPDEQYRSGRADVYVRKLPDGGLMKIRVEVDTVADAFISK